MPIKEGKDKKGCYYQYGDQKRYYYKCDDLKAAEAAKRKAERQGRVIEQQMKESIKLTGKQQQGQRMYMPAYGVIPGNERYWKGEQSYKPGSRVSKKVIKEIIKEKVTPIIPDNSETVITQPSRGLYDDLVSKFKSWGFGNDSGMMAYYMGSKIQDDRNDRSDRGEEEDVKVTSEEWSQIIQPPVPIVIEGNNFKVAEEPKSEEKPGMEVLDLERPVETTEQVYQPEVIVRADNDRRRTNEEIIAIEQYRRKQREIKEQLDKPPQRRLRGENWVEYREPSREVLDIGAPIKDAQLLYQPVRSSKSESENKMDMKALEELKREERRTREQPGWYSTISDWWRGAPQIEGSVNDRILNQFTDQLPDFLYYDQLQQTPYYGPERVAPKIEDQKQPQSKLKPRVVVQEPGPGQGAYSITTFEGEDL